MRRPHNSVFDFLSLSLVSRLDILQYSSLFSIRCLIVHPRVRLHSPSPIFPASFFVSEHWKTQSKFAPPSTDMLCPIRVMMSRAKDSCNASENLPVMNDDSSDARKATRLATSSGLPFLFSTVCSAP